MSANELLDTRGGQVGLDGTTYARRFEVIAPDPDPANWPADWDSRTDEELLTKAGIGTELKAIPGAFCRGYRQVAKFGTHIFHVDAIYDVPSLLRPGAGGGWVVDVDVGLDTDWTAVVRPTDEEIREGIEPFVVGPLDYQPKPKDDVPPAGTEWSDWLMFTVTDSKGKEQELIAPRDPNKQRRIVEGMDWYPATMTITCSKVFDNISVSRTMIIGNHAGGVNDQVISVLGRAFFGRGQLMLAGARLIEIRNPRPVKSIPKVHSVTLRFDGRLGTWQHAIVHTYSDRTNTDISSAIVKWQAGNPNPNDKVRVVSEDIRRQHWVNMSGFLEGLK